MMISHKNLGERATLMIVVTLFSLLLALPLSSAYTPLKINTTLQYTFTSNNATWCNVTTGNAPDGSLIWVNQEATKNLNTFNISISYTNFQNLGDYCFNLVCSDGNQIETGSICRSVTGNGKEAPDGVIIFFFSAIFLVIMGLLLYELIMILGHFASLDLDVLDLAKTIGTYFALFALYQLSLFYLGNPELESWMTLLLWIGAFTHILLPLTGFLFSITIGSLKKKTVDFGTRRILRRQKV